MTSTPKPRYTLEIDHDAKKILRRRRIIYQIDDNQLFILVLEIGTRGDIYRGY